MLVAVICLLGWLTYTNISTISTLSARGQNYNLGGTTITPTPGANGKSAYQIAVAHGYKGNETDWLLSLIPIPFRGAQGSDGESAYQLAQDHGYAGSTVAWLAGLQGVQGTAGIQGLQGIQGIPGLSATDAQTAAAVTAYCFSMLCQGPMGLAGADGANGAVGPVGPAAPAVFFSCVTRTVNAVPTEYEAWKYVNEPDSAYRNQYTIVAPATCPNPVDLTTPPATP
jgi:hypothetical protein